MIIAEKRQITETAIFGGYGGKTAVGGNFFFSIYCHNKRLHLRFGCSIAVLKFGGWQLKMAKLQVGNIKSVKKWSNCHEIANHRSSLLLKSLVII